MRDLTLSIPSMESKRKSKITPSSTLQLNSILLVVIAVLGLTYVFEVNSLGTKGYTIRKLEQELKTMELEQKHLEVQVSNLQTINRIQRQADKLNFVPSTNVTYIQDSDFALK